MDDLDHLLAEGVTERMTFSPTARGRTLSMKSLTTGSATIGFDQSGADLAQRGIDIGLGQGAPAAQAGEHSGQTGL